jgi:hypothetical protein
MGKLPDGCYARSSQFDPERKSDLPLLCARNRRGQSYLNLLEERRKRHACRTMVCGCNGNGSMWKQIWRKWTIDKPAAFGDWLWEVFVVELAAFLGRLTLRQVIAFIPVVVVVVAYAHRIPIPPELILVGDMLAYIDIFSIVLLLSLIGRAATILYVVRQAAEHLRELVRHARIRLRRPDSRHRRAGGARRPRRLIVRANKDDDHAPIYGIAWA